MIRKRIKLEPEKAIFIFVEETLPPTAMLMADLYKQYQDEDGFLYITYSGENVRMSRATLARLTRRVTDFRHRTISAPKINTAFEGRPAVPFRYHKHIYHTACDRGGKSRNKGSVHHVVLIS